MWLVYVAVIALLGVAIGGGAAGGPLVAVPAAAIALGLLGYVLFSKLRGIQIDSAKDQSIPSSGGSAYEPQVDPDRAAPGSSTGQV